MKIVIKLGGSVSIGDNGPNVAYFKKLIPVIREIKKKNQLIVAIGGGRLTRSFGESIKKSTLKPDEKEKIFIQLIYANVLFLSYESGLRAIQDLSEIKKNTSGVVGGIMPRRSTDANAATAAQKIDADVFIKLTNVDGIYTKDPRKYRSAKKIDKMTFDKLRSFSVKGKPNSYGILDSNAIKTLSNAGIKTVVMNGKDPRNITRFLKGKKIGTLIEN